MLTITNISCTTAHFTLDPSVSRYAFDLSGDFGGEHQATLEYESYATPEMPRRQWVQHLGPYTQPTTAEFAIPAAAVVKGVSTWRLKVTIPPIDDGSVIWSEPNLSLTVKPLVSGNLR